jgi:preprotein translocase subunit SecY
MQVTAASFRASARKKTADYIDTVLSRLTIVGAIYLTFVALLPEFLSSGFKASRASCGSVPLSTRSSRVS